MTRKPETQSTDKELKELLDRLSKIGPIAYYGYPGVWYKHPFRTIYYGLKYLTRQLTHRRPEHMIFRQPIHITPGQSFKVTIQTDGIKSHSFTNRPNKNIHVALYGMTYGKIKTVQYQKTTNNSEEHR